MVILPRWASGTGRVLGRCRGRGAVSVVCKPSRSAHGASVGLPGTSSLCGELRSNSPQLEELPVS